MLNNHIIRFSCFMDHILFMTQNLFYVIDVALPTWMLYHPWPSHVLQRGVIR